MFIFGRQSASAFPMVCSYLPGSIALEVNVTFVNWNLNGIRSD